MFRSEKSRHIMAGGLWASSNAGKRYPPLRSTISASLSLCLSPCSVLLIATMVPLSSVRSSLAHAVSFEKKIKPLVKRCIKKDMDKRMQSNTLVCILLDRSYVFFKELRPGRRTRDRLELRPATARDPVTGVGVWKKSA